MIVATAVASLLLFAVALSWTGVVGASSRVVATAREAFDVMKDQRLDDDAREQASRRASVQLFAGFGSILGRGGLSLAASAIPIGLAHVAGVATAGAVLGFLARWDVVAVASVAMIAGYVMKALVWPSN